MHRFSRILCFLSLLVFPTFLLAKVPGRTTAPRPAFIRSGVGDLLFRSGHRTLAKRRANSLLFSKSTAFSAEPDTIHVLAIRVEFQPDNLSTTTGDGTFDLTTGSNVKLDPPPHNKAYFEAQLAALANYYRTVSAGKLVIVGEVYPEGSEDSYKLPNPMVYYNPPEADNDEELRDQRLSELLRDAVTAADADPAVHFDRYESLIVFHAGVGQDFAFDFDPTPNDIPSVYLDRKTLAKALGGTEDPQAWPGIAVDEGASAVTDGIILPETQNQQDYDLALLGTACLMFGHQLGLPALYNTETGRPGIGMWGLMDQGSGNLGGLVPAQPCAWSRVYLGWTKPTLVRQGQDLPVAVWKSRNPHKVYKVPINRDEYFLVENRQRDPNGDGIVVGRDADGNRVEIRLMDDGTLRILPDDFHGVIVQLDDYDYGLPGSGILIWHVDESVLREKLADNKVNTDPDHRAVDLEEADGAQDIGQRYGFLSAGAGAENGVPEDAFWAGNDINKLVNESDEVAFTPWTEPNTDSYTGAKSNISFTHFSDQDTVMSFSVSSGLLQAGFPAYAGAPLVSPPVLADLDGDGTAEILAATEDGRLLCWRGNGQPFLGTRAELTYVSATGDTTRYPDATVYKLSSPGPVFTPAVLYDTTGAQIFWGPENGRLLLLRATRSDSGTFVLEGETTLANQPEPLLGPAGWRGPDSLWYCVLPQTQGLALVAEVSGWNPDSGRFAQSRWVSVFEQGHFLAFASLAGSGFVALQEGGILRQVSADFTSGWTAETAESAFALASADVDGDGSPEVFVLDGQGAVDGFDANGNRLTGFPTQPFGRCSGGLAVGNVDGRGPLEVAFVTDGGRVVVLQHNGTVLDNWPVDVRRTGTSSPAAPILVDLTGDGACEVVLPDQHGGLQALDAQGKPLAGFPVAAAPHAVLSAAAGDVDGDGRLEIVLAGRDGFLYAWKLDSAPARGWSQFKGDTQHTALAPAAGQSPTAEPGVTGLMPPEKVYCYPNPTAGDRATIRFYLTEDADVTIRIYDLSGARVAELKTRGTRYTDNEIVWDVSGVASGVYLAKVEAQAATGNASALVKIAVTK